MEWNGTEQYRRDVITVNHAIVVEFVADDVNTWIASVPCAAVHQRCSSTREGRRKVRFGGNVTVDTG